jgi:endonuclease/exonuclease/phosphatase family metal-dependent hydrolase
MIALAIVLVLVFLLLGGLLWASGGQTVYASSGSGIVEAIPGALEEEPAPPVGMLVILSYSLAYGLGRQRHHGPPLAAAAMCDDLDQVIETIVASGADIVLLQEVDFASQRTHEIDQLYYVAAALGWGYAARAVTWECRYLPWPLRHPTGRLRAGMGVISRYPLVQNVRQRLPPARRYPLFLSRFAPRHTIQMVDVHCGATTLRVLNAYLEQQQTTTCHRQARALVDFVRDVYTPTSVLMGAFSAAADSPSLDQIMPMLIAELGERCCAVTEQGARPAATAPHGLLVHALVGPGLSPLETRSVKESQPVSNHLPLALRLRWALPLTGMNGRKEPQRF